MKIFYKGMLATKHSWSIVGTELILALEKLGCDVVAESNNGNGGIDPRIASNLAKRANFKPKDYLGLSYAIPHNLKLQKTDHKLVVYNYETTIMPPGWSRLMNQGADFILPSSHFVKEIFARNGVDKDKLIVVPHGVDMERYNPDIPAANIRNDKFKFLVVSCAHARKVFDVLVRAFAEEFSSTEPVCLVIKTSRFKRKRQYYEINIDEVIADATKRTKPPEIIVEEQSYNNLASLYNACDAYVSTTRSEGFGLTELEAMACKLPVITTGYGGVLDFLTPEIAYLIKHKIVPANKETQYWHYHKNATMAEPDLQHLKMLMRHVYTSHADAYEKAQLAYKSVAKFTWENAAKQILRIALGEPWSSKYKTDLDVKELAIKNEAKEIELTKAEGMRRSLRRREIELQKKKSEALMKEKVAKTKKARKTKSTKPKLTVSLHSIIFNEERHIGGLLQNVFNTFDELVIVDGGSSDGTIKIIKEFKSKYDHTNKIKLFIRPQRGLRYTEGWNQSEQRNFALTQCTQQWCFMMDADERLDKSFKEELKAILASERTIAYALPKYHYWESLARIRIDNIWFPNYGYRIWKNNLGIKYEAKNRHCQPMIPRYPNVLPHRKHEDSGPFLLHPIHHFHHYKLESNQGTYRANDKDVKTLLDLRRGMKTRKVPQYFDLEELYTSEPNASYSKLTVEPLEPVKNLYGKKVREKNTKPHTQVKRVLFYYENFPFYSGGRYHLWEAALAMARQGVYVHMLTTSPSIYVRDFDVPSNLVVEVVRKLKPGVAPKKAKEFDAVFATPAGSGSTALSYARDHQIPLYSIVLETHNQILEGRSTGLNKDEHPEYWDDFQLALKASAAIYVSTKYGKKKLLEWMPEIKPEVVLVVPPAINTEAISTAPVDEQHEIVYVSRMVAHKNFEHILEAVSDLDNPPVINLIGHGDKALLRKYSDKLKFNIHQNITDKQKFEILQRSKLLVTASTYEGFGMSPLEAFYCKKPVVAYRLPIFEEVHEDRIDYADINDVKMLANNIEKLLTDDKYRAARGEEGYKSVVGKYGLEAIGKKTVAGFRQKTQPRISVCYIVCNEAEFLEYSIASIYDFADEIIIVEGAVEAYAHAANEDGSSKDQTVERIKGYPDFENKITFVQKKGGWKDKEEQRSAYMQHITGDWLLQVDGDEVYKKKDLQRLLSMVQKDRKLMGVTFPLLNFWHNFRTVVRGGQWELQQNRFYRIKTGHNYKTHHQIHDKEGQAIYTSLKYRSFVRPCPGVKVYHYAYCKKGHNVRDKLKYYKDRGDLIEDTWSDWTIGDKNKETHPIAFKHSPKARKHFGRGHARRFIDPHPEVMLKHPYYHSEFIE